MSGYIGTQPVPQATQTRDSFTATSGQTSFATGGYTPNFLDVYLNGVKLASADYTAANGSDVVLASGAATGDILEVVAYTAFDTANVTGATNFTVTGAFTSQGIDDNGNATAITITSDEDVLISTTNINPHSDGSGIALKESAGVLIGVDGTHAIIAARHNSDGEVIRIQKDNSTVGVIGTQGSRLSIGSGDVNLNFNASANSMYPISDPAAGTLSSGIVDLGAALATFKDAYLSGGVYLGGTGSANKLEDYEEGTCNLTIKDSSNNSATMTSYVCRYVKIGSLVHVTGTLTWSSTSALNTSRIQIHGLPFAAAPSVSGGSNRSPVSNGTSSANSFTIPREEIAFGIDPNANFVWGSHVTGNNYDGTLTKQHFGTSGVLYSLQAIYETNA